jgi:hypothetical protein
VATDAERQREDRMEQVAYVSEVRVERLVRRIAVTYTGLRLSRQDDEKVQRVQAVHADGSRRAEPRGIDRDHHAARLSTKHGRPEQPRRSDAGGRTAQRFFAT